MFAILGASYKVIFYKQRVFKSQAPHAVLSRRKGQYVETQYKFCSREEWRTRGLHRRFPHRRAVVTSLRCGGTTVIVAHAQNATLNKNLVSVLAQCPHLM